MIATVVENNLQCVFTLYIYGYEITCSDIFTLYIYGYDAEYLYHIIYSILSLQTVSQQHNSNAGRITLGDIIVTT